MPSKYQVLLRNLGEASLLEFLDDDLVALLELLDLSRFDPQSLAQLLIEIEGEDFVIDNTKVRNKIFESLKSADAYELCALLDFEVGEDIWNSLTELKIRKGTSRHRVLRGWFELPEIEIITRQEISAPKMRSSEPSYGLFPHQINAVNSARKLLFSEGRLMLHMPTGAGKTRTAMNLIADYLRQSEKNEELVIWLAHSEELCEQAAEEFETAWKHLGNKTVEVVRHFRPHTNTELKVSSTSFLIMSLQSAYSLALSQQRDAHFFELIRKVGLVIIDEAHKAVAETYQHVLELLTFSDEVKLLGLTATPGRSWLDIDEDKKLANFFKKNKVTLDVEGYDNPIEYLRAEGYLAHQETVKISYTGDYHLSQADLVNGDFTQEQLREIGKDATRNLRILERAEHEAKQGGNIILFACSVAHAKLLTTILKLRGYKAAYVAGSTPAHYRDKFINDFRNGEIQILVNFAVLTTGFDAPKADVAIIARPTQSLVLYSQMVGRVIRGPRAKGTANCRVVTVVDEQYGFNDLSESFDFWDDIWE